uniref:Uncharacterized protein n=1 Tax=Setaria digitata TaxID=48799 RepID=A0A915PRH1_9BILA
MKKKSIKTDSKYGRGAHRMRNHFQKYAKKCIELDIPAPFAAEVTRHASVRLKVTVLHNSICAHFSVQSRSVELIVVCEGCGAEMKGGALATMNRRNKNALMSPDESLRQDSQTFSKQSAFSTSGTSFRGTPTISDRKVEKISSSARRRNFTSKLQRLLASQTPTRKESNLQGFLEAFKINT